MARRISVELVGDASQLQRTFARAGHSASGFNRDITKASRGALAGSGVFRSLGRSIAFASAGFLGGAGITAAFKSIINETSKVQEETEKAGVLFGRNAKQVEHWSGTLAQAFGVSKGAALEASGQFANMMRPLGVSEKSAARMSTRLVELAADMASFNNVKPAETLQALQAGLAGQVRPLRRFGVSLSDARLKHEAFLMGIYKGKGILMPQQKMLAAYNIILKDTKLQQGDVARNTGSLSVAQSKLTAAIQNTEAGLGQALLPTLVQYTNRAAKWLNNTQNQARIQHDFNVALHYAKVGLEAVLHGVRIAASVFRTLGRAVGGTKNEFKILIGLWVGFKAARLIKQLHDIAGAFSLIKRAEKGAGASFSLGKAGLGSKLLMGGLGLVAGAEAYGIYKGVTAPKSATYGAPQQYRIHDGSYQRLVPSRGGKRTYITVSPDEYYAATGKKPPRTFQRGIDSPLRNFEKPTPRATFRPPPGGTTHKALSLAGRFNLAELGLANAGLTASQADDRRALVTEASITREQIKQAKTLADRIKYTQQLGQITSQIRSIDEEATQKRKDAAQKARDAAKAAKEKRQAFTVPLNLQVAQAKADALASGSDNLTKGQITAAKAVRAAALKAIRSHRLGLQGLIDAWNTVASVNSQLKSQVTKGASKTYHHASTKALTAGLGLARDQIVAIREREAQRIAHRGYVPSGPAAEGQRVVINGPVNVHGVRNLDELYSKLEKVGKRRGQRRGTR